MDKLTAIKIKYDDGTYSDEIPVSVLSENVEWDSTHTLVDVLGSIDVDVTGTIQDQISQLFNEKVSTSAMQDYVTNSMPTYITNWLNTNVNPVGSAVVVDESLTVSGAAADAKAAGNAIKKIANKSETVYNRIFNEKIVNWSELITTTCPGGWRTGYYNTSTGAYSSVSRNQYACTSENMIDLTDALRLVAIPPEGYALCVIMYDDSGSFEVFGNANTSTHPENIDKKFDITVDNYTHCNITVGRFNRDAFDYIEDGTNVILNQDFFDSINVSLYYGDALTDITTSVNNINSNIDEIETEIEQMVTENEFITQLDLDFIAGKVTASAVEDGNTRLVQKDVLVLPNGENTVFNITLNDGYKIGFRSGDTAKNLTTNQYWFRNGDSVSFPAGSNFFRCALAKDPGESTVIDITELTNAGLIISYKRPKQYYQEYERKVSAARLKFTKTTTENGLRLPIICHASDIHGDFERMTRFMDFADLIGADCAALTGDFQAYELFTTYNHLGWMQRILKSHSTVPAICVGNHDVHNADMTDTDIYSIVFDGISEKIGNTTGKTWYYKDLSDQKLRLISVNLYQYGGTRRWNMHLTTEQVQWFANTLLSVPQGYGVIVLLHSPQTKPAISADYPKFWQKTRLYSSTGNDTSGDVFADIVDAFISRTAIEQTYTNTGTPESFTVSADFSGVDTSIEFIAFLAGHMHLDGIYYVPNRTNKMLMLDVCCTVSVYGGTRYPYYCDTIDIPRNMKDDTQDAFNVYAIDRENKTVRVVRVGSNLTYDFDNRDYMIIPYKN